MSITRYRVLQGQSNSAERPVEIGHMNRKCFVCLCMPTEQKNTFHRCPRKEQVKAMRSKTEPSRENKLLFSGTILVSWKNLSY